MGLAIRRISRPDETLGDLITGALELVFERLRESARSFDSMRGGEIVIRTPFVPYRGCCHDDARYRKLGVDASRRSQAENDLAATHSKLLGDENRIRSADSARNQTARKAIDLQSEHRCVKTSPSLAGLERPVREQSVCYIAVKVEDADGRHGLHSQLSFSTHGADECFRSESTGLV